MNDVIIHQYVEPNLLKLTPNSEADCSKCMLSEKTQLLDGGEGYLCKAALYDINTLSCFVPGVKSNSWISVTSELPDPLTDVLVYDSTSRTVEVAFITRHFEWVGVCMSHEITHWMPMPEGPASTNIKTEDFSHV